jgi:hypothetical protein
MQNGGHVSPFLIFFFVYVLGATKKTKKRFAATGYQSQKIFCGRVLMGYPLRSSKKNKIKQNLATQGTIGVRILPFPAFSRSQARKNRRTARFPRGDAAVPEILQAHSASWRVTRLASMRTNCGRDSSRNNARNESGCASIGCCVSSSDFPGTSSNDQQQSAGL